MNNQENEEFKDKQEIGEHLESEKTDKPAGRTIKWVIIIAVILLALFYFIYTKYK